MIVSCLRLQIWQMAKQRQINDIHEFFENFIFFTTINNTTSKSRLLRLLLFVCVCVCVCVRLCMHVFLSITKVYGKYAIFDVLSRLSKPNMINNKYLFKFLHFCLKINFKNGYIHYIWLKL